LFLPDERMTFEATDGVCAVAGDAKLETPEGPLTMSSLAKKAAAVLTRTDAREVRFAMIKDARKLGDAQPVLRITLANGSSFRVGPSQILYARGMVDVAAKNLRAGDELEAFFSYPEGYVYRTDDGEEATSRGSILVEAVAPAGEATTYAFRVNRVGRFLFAAGVMGKAEGI
jgi:hypothetical protein